MGAVIGCFREQTVKFDADESERDLYDAFMHFQSAADTQRGMVKYYLITSTTLLQAMQIDLDELPLLLFDHAAEGMSKYTGPMIDSNIIDFVMKNADAPMSELSLATGSAQQYTHQFFQSRRQKFILMLPPPSSSSWSRLLLLLRPRLLLLCFLFFFDAADRDGS